MIRLSTLIWMVVLTVSAFMLYSVKFQVQSLRTQIVEVSRELEMEHESLNVVAAEWAYLNRPDRLQKLANTYLSTKEVTVEQIAEIEAIPFPKVSQASVPAPAPVKAEGMMDISLTTHEAVGAE